MQAQRNCGAGDTTLEARADALEHNPIYRHQDTNAWVSSLARQDLAGTLTLRAFMSAYRVEQELTQSPPEQKYLLAEIGTGLMMALHTQ
jgi:hypothetical protein